MYPFGGWDLVGDFWMASMALLGMPCTEALQIDSDSYKAQQVTPSNTI